MNGEIKLKIFETHSSAITNFSQENFLLNILLDRNFRTISDIDPWYYYNWQIWVLYGRQDNQYWGSKVNRKVCRVNATVES